MIKKYLILNLIVFIEFHSIKCMEKTNAQELNEQTEKRAEQTISKSLRLIHDAPAEIFHMYLLCLVSSKSKDSLHLAYMLINATKNFRLTDRYCNQTTENLIAETCSISDAEFQLLHRAFSKNNISYPNGKLLYDFSNMEQDECLDLVKVLYTLHLKKDSSDLISPDQFKNLISQALKNRQKEALKYLGLSATYRQLSNINDLGSLSIKIIDNQLPNSDIIQEIKQLFSKPVALIHADSFHLGPLHWAIIFDKIKMIERLIYEMTFINIFPVYEILSFSAIFANPQTFKFILDLCQNWINPHYLLEFNHNILERKADWGFSPNPLQEAFDAGNEMSFTLLLSYGSNLNYLNLSRTKSNAKSALFNKIIEGRSFIPEVQIAIKNLLRTNEEISTEKLISIIEKRSQNIIDERAQKKRYSQKVLYAFGAAILSLIAYQIFNRSSNNIRFAKICGQKEY